MILWILEKLTDILFKREIRAYKVRRGKEIANLSDKDLDSILICDLEDESGAFSALMKLGYTKEEAQGFLKLPCKIENCQNVL